MGVDVKDGYNNDSNEPIEIVDLIEIASNEEQRVTGLDNEHEVVDKNEKHEVIDENEEHEIIDKNEKHEVIDEPEEIEVIHKNKADEVTEEKRQQKILDIKDEQKIMQNVEDYKIIDVEVEQKIIDEFEKIEELRLLSETTNTIDQHKLKMEPKKHSKGHTRKRKSSKLKKVIVRTTISIVTVIVLLFLNLLGIVLLTNYGPSETARNLFVDSVMESSAGKFMATWFFSDEKIAEIRSVNSVIASTEVTDSNLIAINQSAIESKAEDKPIEIIDIVSSTYKGKIVIVRDPSRVTVGVSGNYGGVNTGKTVKDMAIAYNATIAINGGGFEDANGVGNGGTPIGIVISDGKLKFGSLTTSYEVIGFDNANKLVVGKMTGRQALDRGIRDALSFGPILIVNGTSSVINGEGSGLNPRTAIGQRADGAMLLLVIDGRQTNSVGATYADLVNIMLAYGAVNAANLDGGSSTLLYYNGDYINKNSSINGPRNMPTSIIVR